MAIKEDMENGVAEPLVRQQGAGGDSLWMVLLSTAVAVYGSFEFGLCVSTCAYTFSHMFEFISAKKKFVGWFLIYNFIHRPVIDNVPGNKNEQL